MSEYASGILWDWHLFYTLSRIGWTSVINAESWGWIWEWTPAFIGAVLTGINASYSFFGREFPGMGHRWTHHRQYGQARSRPGTLMLLCTGFAEVGCNWKSVF
ncbi:hypothetical protein EV363DRAFT_255867 [Boletus edulis]|uniref:Uncharacterized protein n=1 Tax=Boletus edulis BED1 TaxID=1328754 RepID=A0AAD4G9E6_BOLED|nr:hypothetical protein EV363DRAFT_255867 [Boletus edulis]KAF8431222.1 hypothetical protein L210DRAFT_2998443 [Boletus edulis BED1]